MSEIKIKVTQKEYDIIHGMTKRQSAYFNSHFFNIGLGKWVSNLKHYDCGDEPYTIDECIVICECQEEY